MDTNGNTPLPASVRPGTNNLPLFFILAAVLLVILSVDLASRKVVLTVNGESRVLTTFRHNVGGLLDDAGFRVQAADKLSHPLDEKLRSGMHVEVKAAFPVNVHADGKVLTAWSADMSVSDVLTGLELTLGAMDRVEPAAGHVLAPGEDIHVIRVSQVLLTERTEIAYREIRRSNPDLDRGDTRVLQRGIPGIRQDTVEITMENEREVSAKILQSEMLRVKQDRVVEYGENTALSRGGRTIHFERVFHMNATAYCPGTAESGCPLDSNGGSRCTGKHNNGITASGRKATAGSGREDNPHLVAVDPRVIPLGSRLYLDGFGFAIAADTGGAIKGNRIDILFDSHEEAWRFGRRPLRAYLLPD